MFEHDCDTDEDCEVYFLKPVNEYNILDKIKEANKELFDEEGVSTDTAAEERRKVKFSAKLEEYEPNTEGTDNDSPLQDEDVSFQVVTLNENDVCTEVSTQRTITTIEECAEMLALEVQKKIEAIEIKMAESDEDVEEISEEIVVLDMDTGTKLKDETKQLNIVKKEFHANKLDYKAEDSADEVESIQETPDEDVNDDDDKLSIIVASYLPPEQSVFDEKEGLSPKAHDFKKNFSFRRKNSARRTNCRSPEITNLKLNYKTCCEYRNSDCGKLPKYTGYMSEYGLSRDQLEKREQTLQTKHQVVVEKNLKATEAEVRKMQDNERAFTTWLKNKMRFPINRTKNMFDAKKANNSGGSNRGGVFRQKICGGNKSGVVL